MTRPFDTFFCDFWQDLCDNDKMSMIRQVFHALSLCLQASPHVTRYLTPPPILVTVARICDLQRVMILCPPLAGIATRDEAFDKLQPGTMGGTYGGNAVACAAAVATIQVGALTVCWF
jgi:hypothetical protein